MDRNELIDEIGKARCTVRARNLKVENARLDLKEYQKLLEYAESVVDKLVFELRKEEEK